MGCATGLIALGIGYLVFLHASKEKGSLRQVGRIIGAVIIVVSILSGVCAMRCKWSGSRCHFMGGKMMCPVSGKALAGAASQK